MRATNLALAADRISRRFTEEAQRRPELSRGERLMPVRELNDAGHRFDVVKGGRGPEPESVPERPVATTFVPERQASWSPVPAARQSAGVEQYRRLAAALIQAQANHAVKVVMITSSVAGEGKSLTAANLAVTLSKSYSRNTLLIDADQRDPSQQDIFHVPMSIGLCDYLRGRSGTQASTVQIFPGLTLLLAGQATSDPMSGLTSRRMTELLADAAASFDFVIVDSPPVTLVPDASVLAPLVDATVLVIAAGSTQYDSLDRAVTAIGRERIIGTVLNRADAAAVGGYGYGYGYGHPRS